MKSEDEDRLIEVAFETPDVQAMRDYLASKGVAVPATVSRRMGWQSDFPDERIEDPAWVGLGVSSHVATRLEMAVFSNVRIEQGKK